MQNKTNKEKYLHLLHDTIILLGGKREISDKIVNLDEVTEQDIDDLRQYNCSLIDNMKFRLDNIQTIKIKMED
jgi:hypothetical protein